MDLKWRRVLDSLEFCAVLENRVSPWNLSNFAGGELVVSRSGGLFLRIADFSFVSTKKFSKKCSKTHWLDLLGLAFFIPRGATYKKPFAKSRSDEPPEISAAQTLAHTAHRL